MHRLVLLAKTKGYEVYFGKWRSQAERNAAADLEKKAFEKIQKEAQALVKALEMECGAARQRPTTRRQAICGQMATCVF